VATLTHTQQRTLGGAGYRVTDTVTAATEMPLEVFVFQADPAGPASDTFRRVAHPVDIAEFPSVRTPGQLYYRRASVAAEYPTAADARKFAETLNERLQRLVTDYTDVNGSFVGVDANVVITP